MGDIAQAGTLAADSERQQLLLFGHIVQLELDANVAAGVLDLAPDQNVGLLEHVPGGIFDFAAACGVFDDVALGQRTKLAAAVQVAADHASHVGIRRQASTLEREWNHRDRRGSGGAVFDVDRRHIAAQTLSERHGGGQQQDECGEESGDNPWFHGGFHPS